MKILVFDNYDSFTYNLVHLVEKITHIKVDVHRNDQIPLERVKEYDKIIKLVKNLRLIIFNRRFCFYLFHSIFLEKYITAARIINKPILPTNNA
mgnify:CR=1 FL=1